MDIPSKSLIVQPPTSITMPLAVNDGVLEIGGKNVQCAVLDDGRRVITQESFLIAIGRAKKAKGGQGGSVDEGIPAFIAAKNLAGFISEDMRELMTPIKFKPISGGYRGVAYGYRAELLPKACYVYLEAGMAGALHEKQRDIAEQCGILLKALASVGIIALIDEATGYQADRARDALQQLLKRYISEELLRWVPTFPKEYYRQLFRLRGLTYSEFITKRPGYIGHITNDVVYKRLAPKILEELQRLSPKNEKGRRRSKLFQHLTTDVGHPKLREHLAAVIALMKASRDYDSFQRMINMALPRFDETGELELFDESSGVLANQAGAGRQV